MVQKHRFGFFYGQDPVTVPSCKTAQSAIILLFQYGSNNGEDTTEHRAIHKKKHWIQITREGD